jgi:hypothetical protein
MKRELFLKQIEQQMKVHPACGVLGPRQAGKTTLARQYAEMINSEEVHFFDLEKPFDLERLQEPYSTLEPLEGLVIIDEIQLVPNLFPVLRVLIDERPRKFLILGSASWELIKQSSETLAGRIGYIELPPFTLAETNDVRKLWRRGGFPRSYLASNEEESVMWRQSYITTFLERDIPNLGIRIPPIQMRRFWMMLAHTHGQIFNASQIGKSLGVTDHTVRRYLDILVGTFMIRHLQPWHENISKRQVKSPKIYFRDSGIFHSLLGLNDQRAIESHPRLGASWEGFALEQTIQKFQMRSEECFFWSTLAGAELDLFFIKDGKKLGFEFKFADAPKITSSMRISVEELKLDHLYIIYPGNQTHKLNEKMTIVGIGTDQYFKI